MPKAGCPWAVESAVLRQQQGCPSPKPDRGPKLPRGSVLTMLTPNTEPCLEGFEDVRADAGVLQEDPGLINKECLEQVRSLRVTNDGIGAVKDVKEQRFEDLGVLVHALEIEALEPGEGDGVLRVVEQEPELAALSPPI